jgi:hypothetical protein
MGRMINPYEAPLTRDEYEYLKSREERFKIQENERMFGPLGQVEGHEWPEVEEDGPVHEGEEPEVEEEPVDYDADDILFVDSIGYGEHQQLLKEMGRPAGGDKATVRQRLLDAIKEEGGIKNVVEFDEDDDDEEEVKVGE